MVMENPAVNQGVISTIADDLAGACDCGAEFLGISPRVTVVLHAQGDSRSAVHAPEECNACVFNTESRDLEEHVAAQTVGALAAQLAREGSNILLKKGDSAFRGNFAAELVAAVTAFKPGITVVAPAIPDYGRTTVEGVQLLHGAPIADSFYREDPKQPVLQSSVLRLLQDNTPFHISHLSLSSLRSRTHAAKSEIARMNASLSFRARGTSGHLIVADAETDDDLRSIARLFFPPAAGTTRPAQRVIFAGGQGIAKALAHVAGERDYSGQAQRLQHEPSDSRGLKPQTGPPPAAPAERRRTGHATLLVCGTLHPVSRHQTAYVAKERNIPVISWEPGRGDTGRQVKAVCRQIADAHLRHPAALLLTPERSAAPPAVIERELGEIAAAVRREIELTGLFVTGGSSAFSFLKASGVSRLSLATRISFGAITAYTDSGSVVCVKGGSLGSEDVMARFLDLVAADR